MSDFLQFIDRIPSLPNRKKITHSDSSVEYATIEYADEPVEEGTFLNKANFNRLNAVLGYNEVSVEQYSKEAYVGNITPTTPTPTWSTQGTNIGNTITQQLTYFDRTTERPTITYKALNDYVTVTNFYAKGQANNNREIAISSYYGGTEYYHSTYFNSNSSRTQYDSNYYNTFSLFDNMVELIIDMKQQCSIDLEYNMSVSSLPAVHIYGSYDNITYTDLGTLPTNNYYNSNNDFRYYKIVFRNSYSSTRYAYVYYLYIKKVTFPKQNNFTIDEIVNVTNNQRILIITPNYEVSGIASNTLNNISIDTILQPNKYYELVYNSTLNKFIAEEVRNAN